MSDPAWFPSAAMQTLGAMYAIFVAIYVLALQKSPKRPPPKTTIIYPTTRADISGIIEGAISSFNFLSVVVCFTILYNAYVLYNLSVPAKVFTQYQSLFYFGCFVSFCFSIGAILINAVLLSGRIAGKRK